MLLLPDSLRNLGESFGVQKKSYFPFDFVNDPNIDLNYIRDMPSIDCYENFYWVSGTVTREMKLKGRNYQVLYSRLYHFISSNH